MHGIVINGKPQRTKLSELIFALRGFPFFQAIPIVFVSVPVCAVFSENSECSVRDYNLCNLRNLRITLFRVFQTFPFS